MSFYNVVVRNLAVPHGKTIVMFAGDGNVLHARRLCHLYPGSWIKVGRIKKGRNFFVDFDRYLLLVHYPFAIAKHTVDTPMNEQSELCIFKPFPVFKVFGCGLIRLACNKFRFIKQKNNTDMNALVGLFFIEGIYALNVHCFFGTCLHVVFFKLRPLKISYSI